MPIRIFLSGSKRFFAVSPTSLDAMGVIPINPIAPVFLFSFFDFPSDSTTIIALNNGINLMAFCSAACFLIFFDHFFQYAFKLLFFRVFSSLFSNQNQFKGFLWCD